MKVMSFNIQTSEKQDEKVNDLVKFIETQDADVVGLQEVCPKTLRTLGELLQDYQVFGVPRDVIDKFTSEACPVLVKKKYEVISNETIWLSDTPDKPGSKFRFASFPRIVTHVRFIVNGKEVNFYNTHLEWIFERIRRKQANVLLKYMEKGTNCILTGDMNAMKTHLSYKMIALKYDSLTSDLTENTIHANGKKSVRKLPIDHMFVSQGLKATKVKIVKEKINGRYLSDHYPIMADIDLK